MVIYNFLGSHWFLVFFPYSHGHLWNKVVIWFLFLWKSCMNYSGRIYIFFIKYMFLVKHGFWWSQTNIKNYHHDHLISQMTIRWIQKNSKLCDHKKLWMTTWKIKKKSYDHYISQMTIRRRNKKLEKLCDRKKL